MTTAILARPALRSAIGMLSNIVERRNTIPVLANALFAAHPDGGAMVRTNNLDIQATVRIPDALVDEGFAITVPAHIMKTLESKAPATDHVAVDHLESGEDTSMVALDFEGLRMTVAGITARDFPELVVEGEIHGNFEISSATLLAGLEAVALAMSTEETRYYLNGAYMHPIPDGTGIRLVATDGHRLAQHDMPLDCAVGLAWGAIVPRATVNFLIKVLKAKGAAETTHIVVNTVKAAITVGNTHVITKLVDGTYPDYGRVVPMRDRGTTVVTVNRDAMIAGIKAVSSIASERGRAVRMSMEDGRVRLSVNNVELGTATMSVPANVAGDTFDIGFNANYATTILGAIDAEEIEIRMSDAGAPAVIMEAGAATLYVLMPMRV